MIQHAFGTKTAKTATTLVGQAPCISGTGRCVSSFWPASQSNSRHVRNSEAKNPTSPRVDPSFGRTSRRPETHAPAVYVAVCCKQQLRPEAASARRNSSSLLSTSIRTGISPGPGECTGPGHPAHGIQVSARGAYCKPGASADMASAGPGFHSVPPPPGL